MCAGWLRPFLGKQEDISDLFLGFAKGRGHIVSDPFLLGKASGIRLQRGTTWCEKLWKSPAHQADHPNKSVAFQEHRT